MNTFNKVNGFVLSILMGIVITGCASPEKSNSMQDPSVQGRLPGSEKTQSSSTIDPVSSPLKKQDSPSSVKLLPADEIENYPENSTFSEVLGFPEYVIGTGDILEITEWKTKGPNIITVPIRHDGRISFSFLENIKVGGLTPTQVDDLLTSKLEGFVRQPRIDVVVKEFKSKRASALGEVKVPYPGKGPGFYPLSGKTR
ncbi:MAG: hypothetical protein GY786_01260, partial [Proteobacteria bacterium]|nr:hypothetical protein [Pseudomonadota bacterium]